MKQTIFVIMIIATIVTATGVLPSLVTGSMNIVMAQGQNMTGVNSTTSMTGNMTETESLPSAGQTGFVPGAGSNNVRDPAQSSPTLN